MLRLYVLGTLRLVDDEGKDLEDVVVQPRTMALLSYLAAARPFGPHQRDRVIGMFWPELDQEHARAALRKALHRLRAAVGDDAVQSLGADLLVLRQDMVWCDAVAFEQMIATNRLRLALEMYKGELLPGFYVPESGEFERWIESERSYLQGRAASAAWGLVEFYAGEEQFTNAAHVARDVARFATADERMLRKVLTLLDRLGDRAGAMNIYRVFADRLWKDFETRPSGETVRLVESIQAHDEPPPRRSSS